MTEFWDKVNKKQSAFDYPVIPRAFRPVGISSNAVRFCTMLLNIENPRCTMLIGADGIESPVLEIATSLCSSQ